MSFMSPAFTQTPYASLVGQSFVAMDRGDMYVPSGSVATAAMMAAGLRATPNVLDGTIARPVPVTYLTPKANVRARSAGLITPTGRVSVP